MKRDFLLNIAFLLAINLIVKPLYVFGVDRSIQNLAGQGSYGFYFELFNFTFIFQILTDLGIQLYNNRYVAQHPHRLAEIFPVTLGLKFLLGLVFGVFVVVGGYFAGYLHEMPQLLFGLACIQLMNAMILYLRSNISGMGWYFADSVMSVLDKALLITVLGIPLWMGYRLEGNSIMWFVYAQIGALSVSILTAALILRRSTGGFRVKWAPKDYVGILRNTYPYALSVALMSIYTRIDGVMIGRLLEDGKQQADWYASAYRLLDAMGMIGYLFATLLLPMFSRIAADRTHLKQLAEMGIKLIWGGALVVVPSIILFRAPIMITLYEHANFYSADLLGWLIAGFIPISGGYIFGTLLLAEGKQGWLNRFYFLGIPVNILLNLWLLPRYKAEGAAIATLGTQIFIFTALLYSSRYWLGFSLSFRLLIRFLILLIISTGLAYFFKQALFPFFGWWAFAGSLGVGMLVAVILRILDIEELIGLLKKRAEG